MGSFIEKIRKEQIVNTAIMTIARNGFINTSLEDIARNAEISKGIISYYFKTKDTLICSVINRIMDDLQEEIIEKAAVESTCSGKIAAGITANFDYMAENRQAIVAFVDLWSSISTKDDKHDYNSRVYEKCIGFFKRLIAAGMEKGEFKQVDSGLTASIIQAAIDGMMIQWIFNEQSVDLRRASGGIIHMAERLLR
ncbi:MAG: TetR family transcriptional regulator [Spirochaetes bacterium]|jgi:AcrR family transcriptional regulator|nr:TetR family transcriptional regulator [Spirochaetota bacterium]